MKDTFITDYLNFISNCKTERECVKYAKNILEEAGFKADTSTSNIYITKNDKTIAAFKLGKDPLENGMNIICAHIDSPRLDIKMNPVFSEKGITFLETHYYGDIRKYQWVTRPLAIHGVVFKKDGTSVDINIGEKEDDPVFYISDLLPPPGSDYITTADTLITDEELNLIVGNTVPTEEQEGDAGFKAENVIMALIKEEYNIEKEDFYSAELEVVPAEKARYVGFDKNLIAGYGHDDRACAFASLTAFIDTEAANKTTCLLLVDNEETGSVDTTGISFNTFENMVAEIIYSHDGNELTLRRCLANSNILSSDVNIAFDPHHANVLDTKNICYLGKGTSFCKFTGGQGNTNNANPEYIKIVNALDSENIPYQMSELRDVENSCGRTIALFAARYGMSNIDIGIPVLAIHAPIEVIDKRDLENTEKLFAKFLTL